MRYRALGRAAAVVTLAAIASAVAILPAQAADLGPLTISPKSGDIYSTLTMRTQGACPKGSNAVVARIYGPGFPERGQNVTGVAPGNMSLQHGFSVLSLYTMKDLAAIPYPPVVYNGTYTVAVSCLDATGPVYGQYVGRLTFAADGSFTAESGGAVPATPKPGIKVTKPVPTTAATPSSRPTPSAAPSMSNTPGATPTQAPSPSASAATTASGNSSTSSMNPLLPALGGLLVGGLIVAAVFVLRGRGRSKTT